MDFDFNLETITPDLTTILTVGGTGCLQLPSGTTAQEPGASVAGAVRWNSTVPQLEYFNGTVWIGFAATAPTAGQILIGTSSNSYVPANVAAGTGIGIVTGSGTLTINNAGVTSFNTRTGAVTLTSGDVATAEALTTGAIFVGTGTNTGSALPIGLSGAVLTSNGTTAVWENTVYVASVISTPSTLVSGTTYSGTVTTNLGTQNIVESIYNNATLQLVQPHAFLNTSNNSATLEVTGNSNSYLVAVATGTTAFTVTPNTLVSGNTYSATITHNLGTNNYIACVYNNSTGALVIGASLQQATTNTLVLQVTGNTTAYRVVLTVGTQFQVTPATLVSGTTYSSTITHNLGTNSLVVCVWNNATGKLVTPLSIQQTSTNALVLEVTGNTTTYNVIIVSGTVIYSNSGNPIRTYTFYASSLDNPSSSDWAVNSLAPVISDPSYISMAVRQFSTSAESGVGTFITVPSNAANITISFKGRAQVAPASSSTIIPYLYVRSVPNGSAVGSWSAANVLSAQTVPVNAFFQYYTQATASLSTYGMSPGGLYLLQFDISTTGTYTTSNWLMAELTFTFT